jgi:hypothetical protein
LRGFSNGASFVGADESAPIDQRIVKGVATDTAILRFQTSFTEANSGIDVDSMVASHDKVFEIPVNSKNKWMLKVMRERNGEEGIGEPLMLIKDVPDVLFPACSTAFNADGSIVPFDNMCLAVFRLFNRNGLARASVCLRCAGSRWTASKWILTPLLSMIWRR